jgi:hypothetical protein
MQKLFELSVFEHDGKVYCTDEITSRGVEILDIDLSGKAKDMVLEMGVTEYHYMRAAQMKMIAVLNDLFSRGKMRQDEYFRVISLAHNVYRQPVKLRAV